MKCERCGGHGVSAWDATTKRFTNCDWCHGLGSLRPTEKNERKPYACPICDGHGTVPPGFYSQIPGSGTSIIREGCRACDGKGIVWSRQEVEE